jgi:hypothetical protein
MAGTTPNPKDRERRRQRTGLIILAATIFLLVTIVSSQQAFNLTFLRPTTSEQTLIFSALSALIFLALVALTFVLLRTLSSFSPSAAVVSWAPVSAPRW